MNKITAIIVTFNPDLTIFGEILERIASQVDSVLLVDNASDNAALLSKTIMLRENVSPVFLDDNIGLAAAQNLAISKIIDKTNFIILFDQDSLIQDNLIKLLLDDAKKIHEKKDVFLGAIGPSFYDPNTMSIYPATIYYGPFIKQVKVFSEPVEATYLIASGCLISTDVLREVGLMKDELFIDYIDVEWSLRAKSKGYNLYISPNAKMAHTIGDARRKFLGRTISIHSPFRRYFLVRNSFYMIRLNYIPLGYKTRECIFNIARILTSIIYSDQKMKTIKSAFYGVIDGIAGRFGPLKRKI